MSSSSDQESPPTFGAVLKSAVAALFGVQSDKNRERDFTRGRPIHFVMVGLLVTAVFILAVWGVVKLVLGLAGL